MEISVGGFGAYRTITPEERKMFEKLIKEVVAVKYELIAVSTQVVAGINYLFFCRALQVGQKDYEAYNVVVAIHEPLPGNGELPSITDISKVQLLKM